ncbi:MAG: ABC transporter substrate-binding protein [Lachnospiraceae bacterium]|nr:ABC transporter substrate-binding protein [Lachnospiraceae bacterium]
MKKLSKIVALLLVLVMVASSLAGCGQGNDTPAETTTKQDSAAETTTKSEEPAQNTKNDTTPLVVGYSPFSEKFSPFFSETAYDQDVWAMTQISLLTSDRQGAVIQKGIEGETINYNGTDYTYYGPADLTITENADGTVWYDFTMRDDLVFSDGTPITIDDVIFTMYALCDPSYDGSSTLFAQPIEGMDAYRSDMDSLLNLIYNAGRDNTNFDLWDEATQTGFWEKYDAATQGLAQEIVDYLVAAGYNEEGDIQGAAGNWGFAPAENTIESFAQAIEEAYGADVANMINTENAGSSVEDLFPGLEDYSLNMVTVADPVTSITGIQKTGDYSMRVVLTQVDATAIYQLGVTIAPLHYYGETDKYDYDNNKFGFDKGDLSHLRSVTTKPMGAGPYKFIQFADGVVNFEANETYFQGAPKIKYVNFLQLLNDNDKIQGVITGTVDVTDPSYNDAAVATIADANGGEQVGPVITTNTVDNLGYGYIGQNANQMKVGNDPASDASKNLRKATATILAVYRDVANDSYYGDRASTIQYPISNTSWAAPQPSDDGYKVAFSVDVNGNDIYTSDMTAEQKYEAAKQASLGFFEAAGYTVTDGKVTAAPAEGGPMEFEAWIPADGTGDHPAFMILTEAQKAFEDIGITFKIKDLTNSSDLWTALSAQSVQIWAAAWGATVDPDMYQIYFSGDDQGHAAGGSNYQYAINDPELNSLILAARQSTDQSYRKAVYKACLDIIVDWAVEIPNYQRQNCIIFSTERVNMDTITPDITTFYGWMSEIQNMELAD